MTTPSMPTVVVHGVGIQGVPGPPLGNMAATSLKGNLDASIGPALDLNPGQVRTMLAGVLQSIAERIQAVGSSGGAVTLDASTVSTMHRITLSANCTITLPAAVAGNSHWVRVIQDGVGTRTLTWVGVAKWTNNHTIPIATTGPNRSDLYYFICDSAVEGWIGGDGGRNIA